MKPRTGQIPVGQRVSPTFRSQSHKCRHSELRVLGRKSGFTKIHWPEQEGVSFALQRSSESNRSVITNELPLRLYPVILKINRLFPCMLNIVLPFDKRTERAHSGSTKVSTLVICKEHKTNQGGEN